MTALLKALTHSLYETRGGPVLTRQSCAGGDEQYQRRQHGQQLRSEQATPGHAEDTAAGLRSQDRRASGDTGPAGGADRHYGTQGSQRSSMIEEGSIVSMEKLW